MPSRRATVATGLAVALAAASLTACAKLKPAAAPDGGTDMTLGTDGTGTTTAGGSQGTSTTARAGTPSTAPPGPTSTTAKGQSRTTTTAVRDSGAKGGAGAYARTLLQPQASARIVVEVMAQSNAAPTATTKDHLRSVLSDNAKKPVSLAAIALPGGAQNFTADDIRALADRSSTNPQNGEQAVVRLLFLHGTFQGDDSILGISVRGDTAAVFVDQVRSSASPIAPRSTIEDAVTEHELGHLLGLVDLVLHTGRGDSEHPGHSRNKESVMYWAVESDIVSQITDGPPPVDFDTADRADLTAIRNGA